MYTSGTTGSPKGVMLSHRNVKTFVQWGVERYEIGPSDRMSNHSAVSFDLSVFDIFGSFFGGATLCPITEFKHRAFPATFIRDRKITVWFSVPSVLGMMLRTKQLTPNAFPDLRLALFCGEALATEYANAWIDTHPHVPIVNLYGPTEATIACAHYQLRGKQSDRVPLGQPCRDSEILVLKQDSDELADVGEIGRLIICGSQLSPGYWRRPDLTDTVFGIHPFKKELRARAYD